MSCAGAKISPSGKACIRQSLCPLFFGKLCSFLCCLGPSVRQGPCNAHKADTYWRVALTNRTGRQPEANVKAMLVFDSRTKTTFAKSCHNLGYVRLLCCWLRAFSGRPCPAAARAAICTIYFFAPGKKLRPRRSMLSCCQPAGNELPSHCHR